LHRIEKLINAAVNAHRINDVYIDAYGLAIQKENRIHIIEKYFIKKPKKFFSISDEIQKQ
jgi:hypothetical protein